MKNIKNIQGMVILLLIFTSNIIFSNPNNNLNLGKLSTEIASSKVGKDYLAYTFAYGLMINYVNSNLTPSEKSLAIEKINNLGNASFIDLNDTDKKEMAEALGFKNHVYFNDLYSGYIKSQIDLKESFPSLNKLSTNEIESVILSAYNKTDVFQHMETMYESFLTCFGRKTAIFLACVGVTGVITTAVFSACMATAIGGEVAATGPASVAVLSALLGPDVSVCAVIATGGAIGGGVVCLEAYASSVFNNCW